MKRRVPRLNLRPDLEKTKKRRRQPETALQMACHQTLMAVLRDDVVYTAIGHQGVGARHGALLKKMGVKAGVWDAVIFWVGPYNAALGHERQNIVSIPRVLWIEFKAPEKGLSDGQVEWGDRVQALHHNIGIVRSQSDLLEILKLHGVPMRLAK